MAYRFEKINGTPTVPPSKRGSCFVKGAFVERIEKPVFVPLVGEIEKAQEILSLSRIL